MKQNKPTVTVAVSAYNEEQNIVLFLESVLQQRTENLTLEKILVISDGSTDKTVERAKSLKSSLIEVRDHKERIGKSTRLNEIYSIIDSDYLVQTDADVIFADKDVIEKVVRPMSSESKVEMCGGNTLPLPAKGFTERAVKSMFDVSIKLRTEINEGNNGFSANGGLLAYKKGLYKKLCIPENMIANDVFTYYQTLFFGSEYRFVEEAIVYFKLPRKLSDHISQYLRAAAVPRRMLRYFPRDLVYREEYIPKHLVIKSMLIEAIKNPIGFTYIFLVNKYCQTKVKSIERKLNAKWDMAYTTKRLK